MPGKFGQRGVLGSAEPTLAAAGLGNATPELVDGPGV